MTKEEFLPVIQAAIDSGFRKCYFAKGNGSTLYKGKIYFNITGTYEYKNWQFVKVAECTKENLQKIGVGI
jgi:hypothetical protein